MTIRTLADAATPDTAVSATVCVVGAGVAGLIAAVRLASDPLVRVVVIESGTEGNPDPATEALDAIENPSGNYLETCVPAVWRHVVPVGRQTPADLANRYDRPALGRSAALAIRRR